MYDPVQQRRINWGWAKVIFGKATNAWDASCHTLPRVVTWNPELQQLVYSPLPEQSALRGSQIGEVNIPTKIKPGESVLLSLPTNASKQVELNVTFAIPTTAVRITATVLSVDGVRQAATFHIDFTPATAGRAPGAATASGPECPAQPLRLSQSDKSLELRVFMDHAVAEAYWMGGRVACTIQVAKPGAGGNIHFTASGPGATVLGAQAWPVKSPWVSPEQVVATPRQGDSIDSKLMVARIEAQQRS